MLYDAWLCNCYQRFHCVLIGNFSPLFQATPATRTSTIAAFQDIKAIKESERRVIGGYIVEEVIGKGAFGTVYQVR